jgi:hypothetical protein
MNLYPIDLLYMGYVIQNLVPLSEDAWSTAPTRHHKIVDLMT